MGRKPLSVMPTKMYLFKCVIGMMSGLTRKTGKGVSESIRMAITYYVQNHKEDKKCKKSGRHTQG